MRSYKWLYFVFLSSCSLISWGQSLRFGSGVFAGINKAQIDGDDMQGYDKPGYNFGLRGIAYLFPKVEFHTELTYSQQGSQSKNFKSASNAGRKLYLDYVGISGMFAINDWFHPIKEYYRLQLIVGGSVKRLIRTEFKDLPSGSNLRRTTFGDVQPYFNSNDLALILGANIKFTQRLGISFRYNRSMNKLLDADIVRPILEKKDIISMKGYFLSADIFYHF
jgi:hypothetical protein